MSEIPPIIDTSIFRRESLERLKSVAESSIEIPPIIDEATYRRLMLELIEELEG